jgi:hypothetical protein
MTVHVGESLEHIDWHQVKADLAADDFDNGRSAHALHRSFAHAHGSRLPPPVLAQSFAQLTFTDDPSAKRSPPRPSTPPPPGCSNPSEP